MKYFKYKSKYLELKHILDGSGGSKGSKGSKSSKSNMLVDALLNVGKGFVDAGKNILGLADKEKLEIYRIVKKYSLIEGVEKYKVKSFLDKLKKEIVEAKKEKNKEIREEKLKELNYVLTKHSICQSSKTEVYDQKKCFEETYSKTKK